MNWSLSSMMRLLTKKTKDCSIHQSIIEKGFFEMLNRAHTKAFYSETYDLYDQFIDQISKDEELSELIQRAESKFVASENQNYFKGAPTGYRDCNQKFGKKDQKIYFQFCEEYYSLLKKSEGDLLKKYPVVSAFFDKLLHIDQHSKLLLTECIDNLETSVKDIGKTLFGCRSSLTVIIRILRYNGNELLCTSPHYDKSGLTLTLDNDDKVEDEKVLIGPYMEDFDFQKLRIAKRKFNNKNATSGLLFPGACLAKLGLNLNPTPHAVLPARRRFRHSLIAFCLVPGMETQDIATTIVNKTELAQTLFCERPPLIAQA